MWFSLCSGHYLDECERDNSDSENIGETGTETSTKRQHRSSTSGDLFHSFPDLSSSIDLHFRSHSAESHQGGGYFTHFDKLYEEHRRVLREEEEYRQRRGRKTSDCLDHSGVKNMTRSTSYTENISGTHRHRRNLSAGNISVGHLTGHSASASGEGEGGGSPVGEDVPPIWCLECQDALVVVGCGTGRVEVWDIYNCLLKVSFVDVITQNSVM